MKWVIIILIFFVITIGVVIGTFIRDRRYERKKASEVFGPALKEEIEMERAEGQRRRTKFEEALKMAGQLEVTEKTKRPIA